MKSFMPNLRTVTVGVSVLMGMSMPILQAQDTTPKKVQEQKGSEAQKYAAKHQHLAKKTYQKTLPESIRAGLQEKHDSHGGVAAEPPEDPCITKPSICRESRSDKPSAPAPIKPN